MPDRDPAAAARANLATLIALFGLLVVSAALLGLVALVMPQFLGVLLVVGALFVVPTAFHYLVWGWWLSQMKDENPDDDSQPELQRDELTGAVRPEVIGK